MGVHACMYFTCTTLCGCVNAVCGCIPCGQSSLGEPEGVGGLDVDRHTAVTGRLGE